MTRTYTVYFDEESLAPLVDAYKGLLDDWKRRTPFMAVDDARAGLHRLALVSYAIDLLAERVP